MIWYRWMKKQNTRNDLVSGSTVSASESRANRSAAFGGHVSFQSCGAFCCMTFSPPILKGKYG